MAIDKKAFSLLVSKTDELKSDMIRLDDKLDSVRNLITNNADRNNSDITKLGEDIAALKVKSGFWGTLGGASVLIAAIIAESAKKIFGG